MGMLHVKYFVNESFCQVTEVWQYSQNPHKLGLLVHGNMSVLNFYLLLLGKLLQLSKKYGILFGYVGLTPWKNSGWADADRYAYIVIRQCCDICIQ